MEGVSDNDYVVIQPFMLDMGLSGSSLLIYAIIYGYSKKGHGGFYGHLEYLAKWCGCTVQGVIKSLKKLMDMGYIEKQKNTSAGTMYTVHTEEASVEIKKEVKPKKEKADKHVYGQYKNVLLSECEYNKLKEQTGGDADGIIGLFSELKAMKGYKYKSDYLAIKNWGIKAYMQRKAPVIKKDGNANDFDMADFEV